MGATPPRVAAIVINYNGLDVTLQSIASLRRMTYPSFDLVVLDNGSTDGSGEALVRAHPDLTHLRLEENRGSSSGYAAGFRWALERGYDYLLLLNNDIEVEPTMLTELVATAERDQGVGCVGPKCYFHGDRRRLWSAGGIIRFKESVTRERGYGEIDRGQYDSDAEVDYVNGCAILIRREAAEAAGPWDPVFFICVDDADFCMRVKRAGFRCVYAHRAVLYHMVAWSTGGYKPERNRLLGRSSAIFVRRYATPWQWATFLAFSLAALPVAWLRERRRGNQAAAVAKLRGVREGLKEAIPPPLSPTTPPAAAGSSADGAQLPEP